MEQIDYDMKVFMEHISELRETLGCPSWDKTSNTKKSYFIEDKEDDQYCIEYGFSTAKELYDLFDKSLTVEIDDAAQRASFIRTCIAACYKYTDQEKITVDNRQISEFIYEF